MHGRHPEYSRSAPGVLTVDCLSTHCRDSEYSLSTSRIRSATSQARTADAQSTLGSHREYDLGDSRHSRPTSRPLSANIETTLGQHRDPLSANIQTTHGRHPDHSPTTSGARSPASGALD